MHSARDDRWHERLRAHAATRAPTRRAPSSPRRARAGELVRVAPGVYLRAAACGRDSTLDERYLRAIARASRVRAPSDPVVLAPIGRGPLGPADRRAVARHGRVLASSPHGEARPLDAASSRRARRDARRCVEHRRARASRLWRAPSSMSARPGIRCGRRRWRDAALDAARRGARRAAASVTRTDVCAERSRSARRREVDARAIACRVRGRPVGLAGRVDQPGARCARAGLPDAGAAAARSRRRRARRSSTSGGREFGVDRRVRRAAASTCDAELRGGPIRCRGRRSTRSVREDRLRALGAAVSRAGAGPTRARRSALASVACARRRSPRERAV